MALPPGTKLGQYEIVGPLGAGGMGEVYRARDSRLDRSVAIKILPQSFSGDIDRLRRFEQEARSASALNHPNIITIHDLGQDGPTHYIAMELVQGKTLRELLACGFLPIRRAIEIAAQIAEGLTKAHEAGIAHRDLKPENLMISDDGFVKILDFGLAKLVSSAGVPSDAAAATAFKTQEGLVIGTVGYMSPEQATGLRLDFRSDQFSFGLVLYEMVTGKHPFQRKTAAETIVAILREQPEPIGTQSHDAPAPLCWAIDRCLAKEPEKRYVSTRELARELAAKGDLDLDLLDAIASLVDKSLAQQIGRAKDEPRFAMLETIREYAMEKLVTSGEEPLTKRAHAAFCLVLAEEEASDHSGAEGAGWLEDFQLEYDNFRAGLEWLTATGNAEWGLRLGAALFGFWEARCYLAEGRERLGRLLALQEAEPATKIRMRALFAAGVLAGAQGDYASAKALLHQSQDIAQALGDKASVAISMNALAVYLRDQGDLAAAHILFEASLELWKEVGDQKAIARALNNLANAVKLEGDYVRSRSLHAECLVIFQALGERAGIAWSLNSQGDVARDQGDSAAAQALYEQSLVIFRELGDRSAIATTLADLGSLASERGSYALAHSLYGESVRLFQQLNHRRGIARLLECFASTAALQVQPERSLRLAGAAAALRREIGVPLTATEKARLESGLEMARRALVDSVGAASWLEGWALPAEKAVEEALTPVAKSPSVPKRASR
jgi:tetratricopeptide (TPR) repeat protein